MSYFNQANFECYSRDYDKLREKKKLETIMSLNNTILKRKQNKSIFSFLDPDNTDHVDFDLWTFFQEKCNH